jgi:hypothetical protein
VIITGQNKAKEACMEAAKRAKEFMLKLFAGYRVAKCECGAEVVYGNGEIKCEACGKELDAVGYVQQFGEWYIKTTIFVPQKRFRLALSTENNFDE